MRDKSLTSFSNLWHLASIVPNQSIDHRIIRIPTSASNRFRNMSNAKSMFWKPQAPRFGARKIALKHDLGTSTKQTINSSPRCHNDLKIGSLHRPKIKRNLAQDPHVSFLLLPWSPGCLQGAKVVPRVPKWRHKASQMTALASREDLKGTQRYIDTSTRRYSTQEKCKLHQMVGGSAARITACSDKRFSNSLCPNWGS